MLNWDVSVSFRGVRLLTSKTDESFGADLRKRKKRKEKVRKGKIREKRV